MKKCALGIGIVAVMLWGGMAYGSIPDSKGVLHACSDNTSGTLRVIDSAKTVCTAAETAINWNRTGTRGPAGPPGPAGGVAGYEVVRVDFNSESGSIPVGQGYSVGASCPTGKQVIGGGGDLRVASGSTMVMTQSMPTPAPIGWRVAWTNLGPDPSQTPIDATTWAICVAG